LAGRGDLPERPRIAIEFGSPARVSRGTAVPQPLPVHPCDPRWKIRPCEARPCDREATPAIPQTSAAPEETAARPGRGPELGACNGGVETSLLTPGPRPSASGPSLSGPHPRRLVVRRDRLGPRTFLVRSSSAEKARREARPPRPQNVPCPALPRGIPHWLSTKLGPGTAKCPGNHLRFEHGTGVPRETIHRRHDREPSRTLRAGPTPASRVSSAPRPVPPGRALRRSPPRRLGGPRASRRNPTSTIPTLAPGLPHRRPPQPSTPSPSPRRTANT
jgi:hypothetical protein